MTEDAKERARELIAQNPNSVLVTIDANGYPACRTMWTAKIENDFTVYYVTGRGSNKCGQIAANPRVTVFWPVGDSYVALKGDAVVTDDQEIRDMLWNDSMTQYFPAGRTDPNYVVVQIKPRELTCLDGKDHSVHTATFC